MKVAVGILSFVATKAAASKNEQGSAVSSESKGASKDRSSREGGLRSVEVSSAAFEEAERVAAETVDAGVLDVGTTACASQCGDLCGCFDGTAGDDVDCIGLTLDKCYPESLPDDADADAAALAPCLGADADAAADACYVAMCIVSCNGEEGATVSDDDYNKCVDACYGDTETGSTKVPSVLSQA